MLLAQRPKHRQPFPLELSEVIRQTFAEVVRTKLRTEFVFCRYHHIELSQVLVPKCAQAVGNRFRRGDFGPDEPERINKRQVRDLLPFLSQVPEMQRRRTPVPKTNGLIADEELRESRCDSSLD